jgi:PST family polysaccharide transporter
MSVRGRAARSLGWALLESGGMSGLSLLALLAFAHLLTPAEIGVAAIALGVVQVLAVPVEALFHDALVQRRELEPAHLDTAFGVSLALAGALAALGWLLSPALARAVGIPEVGPVFAWMCLSLLGTGLASAIVARQRRALDLRPLAIRSFAGRFAGAAIGVALALLGAGVWSLVAQQVLMTGIGAAALWLLCGDRPRPRVSPRHLRELIGFGLKSVAVMGLNFLDRRLFILLVGAWLGAAAAGFASLAFRVVDMLYDALAGAASQLALPLFRLRRDDAEGLRRAHAEAVGFTCLLGFPVFAGMAVSAPEIVGLFFGPQWGESVPLVQVLAVLALTHFARLYSWPVMAALNAPQMPLLPVAAALAVILLGMPLVGQVSLAAAAGIWAARRVVAVGVDAWALRRASGLGLRAQFDGVAEPLLAAAAMAVAVVLARAWLFAGLAAPLRLAAMVATGALVYGAAMLLLDRARLLRLLEFARSGLRRAPAATVD